MAAASLAQQCLQLLKQEDVKRELKSVCQPIFEVAFQALAPYLYLFLGLVAGIFFLLVVILVLLLQANRLLPSWNRLFTSP